ncbi:MAG: ABC transporter permease [bacterium]|nr:ABC transporter permease [bacterium]
MWIVRDALVLTWRNLIRYRRLPQLIIFSTIQPVMFVLLFNYVFGGAIRLPPGVVSYTSFLLPGILVQAVLFGATQTTVGLAADLSTGMIDRFRSLPMTRSAVLLGRTLADATRNVFVVCLMVAVGYLIGFRFENGFLNGLAGIALVVGFGFTFSWISALLGLIAKSAEAAQAAGFIWIFPLVFASAVFVPVQSMPAWLQTFAKHQPITYTANAVRALMLGGSTADVWYALLWMAGILVVFVPLSVLQYRRTAR